MKIKNEFAYGYLYSLLNLKPVKKIFRFLPVPYINVSAKKWENEYNNGRWTYLNNLTQLSRYSIIVGYYLNFKPNGKILDIACGEGILNKFIHPLLYSEYLGIDIFGKAINIANKRNNFKSTFIQSDASSFNTDKKFGTIIFNECLYYFKNPISVLNYYENNLITDGIIIISMFVSVGNNHIWNKIGVNYNTVEEISLFHKSGASWKVKVLNMK